jgi:hypothetical protein
MSAWNISVFLARDEKDYLRLFCQNMKRTLVLALFALMAGAVFAEVPDAAAPHGPERSGALARWRPENRWFIGIYGGYTNNTLYTGGAEHLEYFKKYEAGHGLTIALPLRFFVFNWAAVQAEPAFIAKNYTVRQTGEYAGALNLYDEYTNSFVDFPLMLHFELPVMQSGVSVFANGGGYAGFWAASHRKGRAITMTAVQTLADWAVDYDEYYAFDERYDNRFDAGLLLGLGVQYDFKPVSVFVEWRYNYSLTDLHKQMQRNQVPSMNDTWTVHAGVLFNSNIFNVFKRRNNAAL